MNCGKISDCDTDIQYIKYSGVQGWNAYLLCVFNRNALFFLPCSLRIGMNLCPAVDGVHPSTTIAEICNEQQQQHLRIAMNSGSHPLQLKPIDSYNLGVGARQSALRIDDVLTKSLLLEALHMDPDLE